MAPSLLGGSTTVLLFLTSLDTVEGLTLSDKAMDLQDLPARTPSSIETLLFLPMCFLPSLMANPLSGGAALLT